MTSMRIQLRPSKPFNLDATLCCGQAFRWSKRGGWWYGIVRDRPLKVRQVSSWLEFEGAQTDFVRAYFGLDDDLLRIFSRIDKDECIKEAIEAFRGLRILRQDPWECLISYICATYKGIAAIQRMILNLSRKFGDRVFYEGYDFYTFPTPERLASASVAELGKCGLGYRAEYVRQTADMVQESGFNPKRLKKLDFEGAKAELLRFSGVGLKVADCILLFSLGKLCAFPVDVWMRRVLLTSYADHFPNEFVVKIANKNSLTPSEYQKLSAFARGYFGEYAGYAQEYLYHFARSLITKS